jgi:hypothetical protein
LGHPNRITAVIRVIFARQRTVRSPNHLGLGQRVDLENLVQVPHGESLQRRRQGGRPPRLPSAVSSAFLSPDLSRQLQEVRRFFLSGNGVFGRVDPRSTIALLRSFTEKRMKLLVDFPIRLGTRVQSGLGFAHL